MVNAIKSKKAPSETEQAVQDYLKSINVEFYPLFCGATVRDNNWQCDAWRVSFNGKGDFEYYTGTGHREFPKGFIPVKYPNPRCIASVDQEKQKVAVYPCAASVLYGLIMDSQANEESFNDWCDNYGYSNDSMKAFDTYQACCDNAKKMRAIFTREQLATLQDMLQDY